MSADDLATQSTRSLSTMALIKFSWHIPVLAPGGYLIIKIAILLAQVL